jgi:DNA modification methylase
MDLDLELAGFDNAAAQGLLEPDAPVDAEPQADRAAELAKKWKTKPGQLWILGSHRLLCGDSTNPADVGRLLGKEKPRLMITDPPYGVNYDAKGREAELGKSKAGRRIGAVENDDRAAWAKTYSLFPGDIAYVWHSGLYSSTVCQGLESCGFQMRSQIIWKKKTFVISRGDYHWSHEPCWYAVRKGRQADFQGGRKQKTIWADIIDAYKPKGKDLFATLIDEKTVYAFPATATTVWEISGDKNVDGGHSTQKPVECMARPMSNHEGNVYEPFSGSGTTIIAAENLGRRCFAIEISPNYTAVALQRYQDATKKTPIQG